MKGLSEVLSPDTRQRQTALDVARIRDEFPILKQQVCGRPLVYLDNAATSQKPLQVIEAISRFNGTPREVLQNPDLMQWLVPVLRADFAVNERYAYVDEAPLACPVSAFGGLQDPVIRQEDLDAWREQTRGRFRLRLFPGNHFFLDSARTMLLEAIQHDLALSFNTAAGSA